MTCLAAISFVVSVCIAPIFQKKFGLLPVAIWGTAAGALFSFGLLWSDAVVPTMSYLALSRVGISLRTAGAGALHATLSDVSNRGRVLSRLRMCRLSGMIVGPIAAGYLAEIDAARTPWLLSSVTAPLSAAVLFCKRPEAKAPSPRVESSVPFAFS